MAAWSDGETSKLIELWSEDSIQEQLEGCRKNREVFEKIVEKLSSAGYVRTVDQCRVKMKKLKQEYRRIKDKGNQTGEGGKKSWRFYEAMNDILGTKPATKPPVVVDNLEDGDDDDHNESTDDLTAGKPLQKNNSDIGEDTEQGGESMENQDSKTETTQAKKPMPKRKRATRCERVDKVMDTFLTKMLETQQESDKLFAELEHKRMKLEERLLEMQERRADEERDREERRRREEREFQLRITAMMCGGHRQQFSPSPQPQLQDPFYYHTAFSPSHSSSTSMDDYEVTRSAL